jgi:hypothetical protein
MLKESGTRRFRQSGKTTTIILTSREWMITSTISLVLWMSLGIGAAKLAVVEAFPGTSVLLLDYRNPIGFE